MHQNNRQHFLLQNVVKNEAKSQAVFAISYVRNQRDPARIGVLWSKMAKKVNIGLI